MRSIYRTIYKQTRVCKITTVFLFQLLQFDYEVWEIIIYFTTCFSFLTFVLYWFPTKNLDRSWTIGQIGRIFFSAEDYTNMSYYNCCGIRPKHSNISEGGGYYNLCGIEIKIVAMLCFITWLLICRVCSHPRRFSISITNQ